MKSDNFERFLVRQPWRGWFPVHEEVRDMAIAMLLSGTHHSEDTRRLALAVIADSDGDADQEFLARVERLHSARMRIP